MMLNAIHAQESKEAAREKACQVTEKLKEMKLSSAAKKLQDVIEETLTYMDFPTQHWTKIWTKQYHRTVEVIIAKMLTLLLLICRIIM